MTDMADILESVKQEIAEFFEQYPGQSLSKALQTKACDGLGEIVNALWNRLPYDLSASIREMGISHTHYRINLKIARYNASNRALDLWAMEVGLPITDLIVRCHPRQISIPIGAKKIILL